jgi:hypothetical protein
MKRGHKFGLLAVSLFTQCLWGSQFANAEAIYTYTGNLFTFTTTPSSFTTADSVTGTFTVATPFADNLSFVSVTPTTYSFADDVTILNQSNSAPMNFNISTNASGAITAWSIDLQGNQTGNGQDNITTDNNDPMLVEQTFDFGSVSGTDFAFNNGPAGTLVLTAPTATPLPSTWTMMLIPLVGAGFVAAYRRQKGPAALAACS